MTDLRGIADSEGKIMIAALDHRGSLEEELHPGEPDLTTSEEIREWKRRMVELYKDEVSGILIDPVYGKEIVDTEYNCAWLFSMEQTGYRGGKEARVTELMSEWSVSQARELGADGVKLLLYFDPENEELAEKQRNVAMDVAKQCQEEGVLFLLEPLSYKIEDSREREVLAIVEELSRFPADIFKIEYPGTMRACERISEMLEKPWVLLSAGMDYHRYKEALSVAMRGGASGFAVGRAVWQDFGKFSGEEREEYFVETALPRMRELVKIVKDSK